VNLPLLAAELLHKDIWYPTILGILVVVFAILLFCGSLYLLLATNMGARLGFLVAFTCLMAFMVVLTSLWVVTASPLNTLKGRIPSWKAVEVTKDLSKAKTPDVRNIVKDGRPVNAIEAANVKAAADESLVQVQAIPSAPQVLNQAFAVFQGVTDYKVVKTYEIGGSKPNPLNFEISHTPLFAVVQFCKVYTNDELLVPFGTVPPPPKCKPNDPANGFLVLKRDLGSVRIPPIVAWISSILLFCLGLLALHWRERDERAAKRAAGSTEPAPVPETV
jgi:hypothetical protein